MPACGVAAAWEMGAAVGGWRPGCARAAGAASGGAEFFARLWSDEAQADRTTRQERSANEPGLQGCMGRKVARTGRGRVDRGGSRRVESRRLSSRVAGR